VSAAALDLPPDARIRLDLWRAADARIVFTNGVFDILHRGHVEYLEEARALGDRLVVGVNSDDSVRRLKGPRRPIIGENDRLALVRALARGDLAVLFEDGTPLRLIAAGQPGGAGGGGGPAVRAYLARRV